MPLCHPVPFLSTTKEDKPEPGAATIGKPKTGQGDSAKTVKIGSTAARGD